MHIGRIVLIVALVMGAHSTARAHFTTQTHELPEMLEEGLLELLPLDSFQIASVSPDLDPRFPPELLAILRQTGVRFGYFDVVNRDGGKEGGEYYQAFADRYDGNLYQMTDEGTPTGLADGYYFYGTLPGEERLEWLLPRALDAAERGCSFISFEEPEWWPGSGHNPRFKARFEERFGYPHDWESDEAATPKQRLDMERLKEEWLGELYSNLAAGLKAEFPEVAFVVPMHEINHYQNHPVTSVFQSVLTDPNIDIIQSQTWDPGFYFARNKHAGGYMGLAYWASNARIRDNVTLWLATDALADFAEEEHRIRYRTAFRAATYSALALGFQGFGVVWPERMIPTIERWEVEDYWKEIRSYGTIFSEAYAFARSELTHYPDVAFVYSVASNYLSYPNTDPRPQPWPRGYDTVERLFHRGVGHQILEGDFLVDAAMLDGVDTLIVEPEAGGFLALEEAAQTIAAWVEQGGNLIWMGHSGATTAVDWHPDSSPIEYIAERLALQPDLSSDGDGRFTFEPSIQSFEAGLGHVILVREPEHVMDALEAAGRDLGAYERRRVTTTRATDDGQEYTIRFGMEEDRPPQVELAVPVDEQRVSFRSDAMMPLEGSASAEAVTFLAIPWNADWETRETDTVQASISLTVPEDLPFDRVSVNGETASLMRRGGTLVVAAQMNETVNTIMIHRAE